MDSRSALVAEFINASQEERALSDWYRRNASAVHGVPYEPVRPVVIVPESEHTPGLPSEPPVLDPPVEPPKEEPKPPAVVNHKVSLSGEDLQKIAEHVAKRIPPPPVPPSPTPPPPPKPQVQVLPAEPREKTFLEKWWPYIAAGVATAGIGGGFLAAKMTQGDGRSLYDDIQDQGGHIPKDAFFDPERVQIR